ncbi:beta-L-arabinofuranosidase domain-containing protein [Pedobacter fastidiosus]|uniref:Glycoside hydrolase family 127 protein n=1 Tax=Pedobacter fastidiosus TaxID=2765361 RepID=A0ABR7KS34_9SPHI|nr:beta-L-arabinofuranosidase domain-containing protein [Pedobacter fastidiosus]MBC6110860.1 glycoside hydrolase family 127 protein [Pedobacter fastidiosus]
MENHNNRLTKRILSLSFIGIICSSVVFAQSENYVFNRKPLDQNVSVQLPLGSIKAKGWLLKQLEMQKDGATGMAEDLYPEDDNLGKNSDWLGGKGSGWERVPYYVKGLIALAYTLDDAGLKNKAQKYIDWTLNNQQANGLFGPPKMKDWWPRMPMMYALQSYYEATSDKRVIPFLTKYFKYELANLDADPLKEWGKSRAGDNMEIAIWLYNKTGDQFLLSLVEKLKNQAYPWTDIYSENQFFFYGDDFQPKHMVNVAQALKLPLVYAQANALPIYRTAMAKGIEHIMHDHGQPEGLGSGTEFLAGRSSTQGVETCTVVEWMQSLETAARVLSDANIGDQLEKVAFNALPAQFSHDFKNHTYYTLPNQVQGVWGEHGFNQDYASGIVSSPYSGYGCCRYNMHMGWPYYVKNSWVATPDGGLAIVSYGPMEVEALVGEHKKIKITEDTNYPFDEQIKLGLTLTSATDFPLSLRIPSWSIKPEIKLNGTVLKDVKAGEIYKIARTWNNGDQLELNFPMQIKSQQEVNNSVSIERGPMVYALEISSASKIIKEHSVKGFADYEIKPTSPWNYGLVLNNGAISKAIKIEKTVMPENPFDGIKTPIKLKLKAKRIPEWGMAYNNISAFDVPFSPVLSNEQEEEITLIPYGAESIRLSCFPTIGKPIKTVKNLDENFTNAMPLNWVFYGGGWYWKDGAVHSASNASSGGFGIHGSKIIATGTDFSDFTYQADVNVNTAGDAGLMFRVSDPAIGADAYKGYYVGINPISGNIEMGKASNQKWVVISSAKYPVKMNNNYKLKLVAKGNQFNVFLDGSEKAILSATDNEYGSGSIGLRTYNAQATFDSVKVKSL